MFRLTLGMLLVVANAGTPPARSAAPCTGGYPISVRFLGEGTLDSGYLGALAHAVAYRWQAPSRRRADFRGLSRVKTVLQTPEPRWPDDWSPSDAHRAAATLVTFRNGRMRMTDPSPASGDKSFDRSLRTIATDPTPGAPDPPPFPPDVPGDSLVFSVAFGGADVLDGPGVIRFAASQEPVHLVPGSLEVVPRAGSRVPASGRGAVVKYDVNEFGNVAPLSIEILESSDRELTDAIRTGLLRARFRPAVSNCRPIAMSVVQLFGR
jgi:hypothetical protein